MIIVIVSNTEKRMRYDYKAFKTKRCPHRDSPFYRLSSHSRLAVYGDEEDLSGKTVAEKQTAVNALGEIKWYDANDQEISSIITLPASGATPVTYKAIFTQSGSYQPSSPATVTVQVPETITFDLTPTD